MTGSNILNFSVLAIAIIQGIALVLRLGGRLP